jgi:cysteine desulfurase/selenocysteine lyase
LGLWSSAFSLAQVRADTPACERRIHFNNAGSALPPLVVQHAVRDHLELEASLGGYEAADRAASSIEATYAHIAEMLGGHPSEIALFESATRAWEGALRSIPFERGQRILVSKAEYGSNYIALLHAARTFGLRLEPVPNDEHGALDVDALGTMVGDDVALIAVTHVPVNEGLVNPAAAIGHIARAHGILYLLDACQSAGHLPLDVETLGCDFLTACGRKYLRGPRGTGFLWVRGESMRRLEPSALDLYSGRLTSDACYQVRPGARRLEPWECHVAGRIGLGVAVKYALSLGIAATYAHTQALAAHLRAQLALIPRVRVRDRGWDLCGIASFTVDGVAGPRVQGYLAEKNVNVRVIGSEGAVLNMTERDLPEIVRASVHYYNTAEEVDTVCGALRDLVRAE